MDQEILNFVKYAISDAYWKTNVNVQSLVTTIKSEYHHCKISNELEAWRFARWAYFYVLSEACLHYVITDFKNTDLQEREYYCLNSENSAEPVHDLYFAICKEKNIKPHEDYYGF